MSTDTPVQALNVQASNPYFSRLQSNWEAIDRLDRIVAPDQPGPLSATELDRYEVNGFRFDPHLFDSTQSESLLAEARRIANRSESIEQGVIVEPSSCAVRSVFQVHRTNDTFRRVAKDPRIVEVVRQILGTDVYVQQSRINFKPALDGKEFYWHSDFETWHMEDGMPRMRAVSVSINLTDNNQFNGPLLVVPGSHEKYIRCVGHTPHKHYEKSLKQQQYGVPAAEAIEMLVDDGGIEALQGDRGSATFFECNLLHASAGNLSPYPRTNLFLVYNSVENPLVDPFGGQPRRPEYLAEREVIPVEEL